MPFLSANVFFVGLWLRQRNEAGGIYFRGGGAWFTRCGRCAAFWIG
ncbi:hypothetical protein BN134_3072 [Cronobacter dublinensis 1210]|uniref:Uncharacterized protein n=1 Tax=Cronobacter dublinensis 1210 TaxID=1208656 RepID=A0ABM9Q9V7_9ENTR|nr:hypothetical protein BN134_3072 [Cronobacter dublinensis 1210]